MRRAHIIVFALTALAVASLSGGTWLVTGCGNTPPAPAPPKSATSLSSGAATPTDTAAPSPSTTENPSGTTALTATRPVAPPSTIQEVVQETLANMSLEEKAAQALLVTFDGTTLTDFTQYMIKEATPAGFLLLGRNVESADQLRALTAALQEAARTAGAPGLFVAADEEGGPVMRVKDGVPAVPAARSMGENSTPEDAGELARATASGLVAQGVNMVLAPVADVVDDEDSFLYARSYGDDPATVSDFVAAVVGGYASEGVITVVKHFPGHGSAADDSHTTAPVSSATVNEFAAVHLPPFRAAMAAGVDGVMMGHFMAPAYDESHPASQSAVIIGGLLRHDLGFEGIVVSDDLEMAAAARRAGGVGTATPAQLGASAVAALEAGCDLLITTSTLERQRLIRQAVVDAVRDGGLSRDRLDEAVTRILSLKAVDALLLP